MYQCGAPEPCKMRVEAQGSEARRRAMQAEPDMIEKNGTWQLVDRPRNRKVIGVK